MPTAVGFRTKAAIRREALVNTPTWPAAAPAAANILLSLLSHDVDERPAWQSHARLTPSGRQRGAQTSLRITGPMSLEATYNGMAVLWALALGRTAYRLSGTANPEQLAVGAYKHTIEIDPVHHSHCWEIGSGVRLGDGVKVGQQIARRATLAIDMGVSCWEFLSCMINTLDFGVDVGGASLDMTWRGHSLNQASATNANLTALTGAATFPVEFHQLDFRIGAYSSSVALDSSNSVAIQEFTLAVDNQLEMRQTELSGLYPAEPKRTAPARITGSFTLPRYESDTVRAWERANTALMATAIFSGPAIGATGQSYRLAFYLPTITLDALNLDTGGAGQQRQAFSFEATSPSSAAAGMPTVQSAETPLIVQVTDADSAKPLYAT